MERFANLVGASPAQDGLLSVLDGAIDDDDTTIELADAVPAALLGGRFRVTIDQEIIVVSASGSTLTAVQRGAEGTTAASHASGAQVWHGLTAESVIGGTQSEAVLAAAEQGLRGTTYPGHITNASGTANVNATSGLTIAWKMVVTPSAAPLSHAVIYIHTAQTMLSTAKLYAVSYETGKVMGRTGDLVSAWASTGRKEHALTADSGQSLVVPGRLVLWMLRMTVPSTQASGQFARVNTPSGAIQTAQGVGWWNGTIAVASDPSDGATVWTPGTKFTENYETMIWGGFK